MAAAAVFVVVAVVMTPRRYPELRDSQSQSRAGPVGDQSTWFGVGGTGLESGAKGMNEKERRCQLPLN